MITSKYIKQTDQMITFEYDTPIKTLSSAVTGNGMGWHQHFVNRYVDKDYQCDDYYEDMRSFLKGHGYDPDKTVGMMTAVKLENMAYKEVKGDGFSILVVVTAGVSNAVDSTGGYVHPMAKQPGTINTWIFVNGELADATFVQAIITATEAKVKALQVFDVKDAFTGEQATGTSTDSVLIGATQQGTFLEFAGPITPLGALIGKAVYDCTIQAINKNEKRYVK